MRAECMEQDGQGACDENRQIWVKPEATQRRNSAQTEECIWDELATTMRKREIETRSREIRKDRGCNCAKWSGIPEKREYRDCLYATGSKRALKTFGSALVVQMYIWKNGSCSYFLSSLVFAVLMLSNTCERKNSNCGDLIAAEFNNYRCYTCNNDAASRYEYI